MTARALLEADGLPELPRKCGWVYVADFDGATDVSVLQRAMDDYYTADQMRAYARAAIASSLAEQPAHSRAQDSGGEAVFRCTVCGSHCDSDGRSLYRPPAEQPAKGEALRKVVVEALTKVENDNTLWTPEWQEWQIAARNAIATPQSSDPADAVLIQRHWLENISAAAALLEGTGDVVCINEARALRMLIASATPPTAQRHDEGENDMLLQAIARGWCSPENAKKVMDPELATAIAREVAALPAHGAGAAVEAEPLSTTYLQKVPDKCDRIIWRGNYHHLPTSAHSPPQQRSEQVAWADGVGATWVELLESAKFLLPRIRETNGTDCVDRMEAAVSALSTQPLLSDQPAGVSEGGDAAKEIDSDPYLAPRWEENHGADGRSFVVRFTHANGAKWVEAIYQWVGGGRRRGTPAIRRKVWPVCAPKKPVRNLLHGLGADSRGRIAALHPEQAKDGAAG